MAEQIKIEKLARKAVRAGRPKIARPFPKVQLEKALQIPYKIKELNGGNSWAPAQVAEAIGIGATRDEFYYVTAASRDFGLTIGTRETATISLTDFGRELVYAPSPEVEHAKKLEAFHKIEIFTKVLQHYKGSSLPEMKYLGNTLEREFGLPQKFHEEFSQVFRDNCKYLDIKSGESPVVLGGNVATPTTVKVGEPTKKSGIRAFVIMPF